MNARPAILAIVIVLATLLASSLMTRGQSTAQAPDAEIQYLDQKMRSFLDRVSFDPSIAYRDLLQDGPLSRQAEGLSTLEQKTRTIHERYGAFRAHEQISARRVGKDVVTMKYLYHCESFPVVWHVTFYRSYKRSETPRENENWQVVSIRFDTNVESLPQS